MNLHDKTIQTLVYPKSVILVCKSYGNFTRIVLDVMGWLLLKSAFIDIGSNVFTQKAFSLVEAYIVKVCGHERSSFAGKGGE